jgi:hypothetical protein
VSVNEIYDLNGEESGKLRKELQLKKINNKEKEMLKYKYLETIKNLSPI